MTCYSGSMNTESTTGFSFVTACFSTRHAMLSGSKGISQPPQKKSQSLPNLVIKGARVALTFFVLLVRHALFPLFLLASSSSEQFVIGFRVVVGSVSETRIQARVVNSALAHSREGDALSKLVSTTRLLSFELLAALPPSFTFCASPLVLYSFHL